ncbi:large subunit ribosomal protein L25 [Candidatus Kinetoplastibacterium oncopeltii TCC290E]|uniref:Large ribosomal subunit protein bL25 n=1 Tax=Candidatus Kinetoplastidibacterium stringomonadis TCC290E TaxID=1208920 RepID=M1LY82_9PROT|nr:50S ribosomal protein L25/general stress protein Ctc [Candidatus Kinetoplastibacterium oncopeltii]AGF48124.1 large subunit ribosomal protein L25 [Candidatus Kinetoplastibacterium oncopeltii TCC290E]
MEINALLRDMHGTSASRRLRHVGGVPAIIYGGSSLPMTIELDHNEIYHALRKEKFHSSILNIKINGKDAEQVILRSVQWHPYKQQVLHIDFQRVESNQEISTRVPLHFLNEDISPAVKIGGAIIRHVITELDITCMPALLPQFINVDLSGVSLGDSVHLSDVKLPIGVSYNSHSIDTNPLLASAISSDDGLLESGTSSESSDSGE